MLLVNVTVLNQLRDVLAECRLRDPEPVLKLTELHMRGDTGDRTDSKSLRSVDQRIKL